MNLPVWLYWEGDKPDWIKDCHQTIFNFGGDVQLVTPEIFDNLWDCDRDIDLTRLCTAHRADFIRAFLLAKHGGIWIDSDCVVMKPLQPLFDYLNSYDFIAYRQRDGVVANNFIGTLKNGKIAGIFYDNICNILRSGKTIEWLTIGSHALMNAIDAAAVPWYEIDVALIQPVCWSNPEVYFKKGTEEEHYHLLSKESYCYMLSNNMIRGVADKDPSAHLKDTNSFFSYLLSKSAENKSKSLLAGMAFRKNTDDDIWVIPEVMTNDMYRVKDVLSSLEPAVENYVIDCGAHIGAFSIMCSLYLKNAEIISFEPNPDSYSYLCSNAQSFGHIVPVNKGVSIDEEALDLYPPDQGEWTGRWSVHPNGNAPITVASVNLFDFIKKLNKPVFILKMDLEGYEEIILNSAAADDLCSIHTLVIETHANTFDHQKLLAFGYKLLFQPHISSQRQFVYTRCLS